MAGRDSDLPVEHSFRDCDTEREHLAAVAAAAGSHDQVIGSRRAGTGGSTTQPQYRNGSGTLYSLE